MKTLMVFLAILLAIPAFAVEPSVVREIKLTEALTNEDIKAEAQKMIQELLDIGCAEPVMFGTNQTDKPNTLTLIAVCRKWRENQAYGK